MVGERRGRGVGPPPVIARWLAPSRGCPPGWQRINEATRPRLTPDWGLPNGWVHPCVHRSRNLRFPRGFRASTPDCKSAIVGSTPTGASPPIAPANPQKHRGLQGFFCWLAGAAAGETMAQPARGPWLAFSTASQVARNAGVLSMDHSLSAERLHEGDPVPSRRQCAVVFLPQTRPCNTL